VGTGSKKGGTVKHQKRTVQVVTLVGISVLVFTWPVLAQDCPESVGAYDAGEYAGGVAVSGHYAYVADHSDVLWVIDASDPADPVASGSVDIQVEPTDVAVSRDYAYVVGSGGGFHGRRVIDVSTPSEPAEVGFATSPVDSYPSHTDVMASGDFIDWAAQEAGIEIYDVSACAGGLSADGFESGDTSAWSETVEQSANHPYVVLSQGPRSGGRGRLDPQPLGGPGFGGKSRISKGMN